MRRKNNLIYASDFHTPVIILISSVGKIATRKINVRTNNSVEKTPVPVVIVLAYTWLCIKVLLLTVESSD